MSDKEDLYEIPIIYINEPEEAEQHPPENFRDKSNGE